MNQFKTLFKMTLKLVFRNKGFLFFLCITPIISVFILNLKIENTMNKDENEGRNVIELEKDDNKIVYLPDTTAFSVKVFDSSGTVMSDYLLKELARGGLFLICRYDAEGMSEENVLSQVKKDAYEDRIGTVIYLKGNFDEEIINGNYSDAVRVYDISDDERLELFMNDLEKKISIMHQTALNLYPGGSVTGEEITEQLISINNQFPQKSIVNLGKKDTILLTQEQSDAKSSIGYAFAIITLGFLFCGVCVAYTVIEESNNKVYTRITLTRTGKYKYLLSKLAVSAIIAASQTAIMSIPLFLMKDLNFGLEKPVILVLIFFLGLVFSLLSLIIGVLVGDVMGANYTVFAVWSISGLLAGMYFPLEHTSVIIKTLSYLMPQSWFVKAAEMLMTGDKMAYSMILCITAAYLIVILSIGTVGLKLKREN